MRYVPFHHATLQNGMIQCCISTVFAPKHSFFIFFFLHRVSAVSIPNLTCHTPPTFLRQVLSCCSRRKALHYARICVVDNLPRDIQSYPVRRDKSQDARGKSQTATSHPTCKHREGSRGLPEKCNICCWGGCFRVGWKFCTRAEEINRTRTLQIAWQAPLIWAAVWLFPPVSRQPSSAFQKSWMQCNCHDICVLQLARFLPWKDFCHFAWRFASQPRLFYIILHGFTKATWMNLSEKKAHYKHAGTRKLIPTTHTWQLPLLSTRELS